MASYRQLSNKKWQVTIDLGVDPVTGKRNRKFKGGFKTKREAIAFSNSYSVDIANGLNVIDNKVLLKDFILSWYNDYKVNTLAINTRTNYQSRINNYIIPYLGNIELGKLTTAMVQQFYNDLIKKELKPNTCKKIIEVIRGCYKYAKKLNLVKVIPTDIETIKEDQTKKVIWNDEELKYFLNQIKDTWLYIPTLIISLTGIRVGELCGLRWSNIDLEEGIITVCEQVINDKLSHTIIHTQILKTNSGYRSISIPQILIDLLIKLKEKQCTTTSYDFVVLDRNNMMCNPRNVSMNFTKTVSKYKQHIDFIKSKKRIDSLSYKQLPQISIHGLRHTHATLLLSKGENVKVISERLGHASVKITLDTYSHVLPEMKKQTATLLDNVFSDL